MGLEVIVKVSLGTLVSKPIQLNLNLWSLQYPLQSILGEECGWCALGLGLWPRLQACHCV
jgi:hypothetical protein